MKPKFKLGDRVVIDGYDTNGIVSEIVEQPDGSEAIYSVRRLDNGHAYIGSESSLELDLQYVREEKINKLVDE